MNLIFDKNVFQDLSFLKNKFTNFIEINDYQNQENNILLLPLVVKKLPENLLLNNTSIYLVNSLEEKHIFEKNIYYFPDGISFYIMKHSSKIITNISNILKLFPQCNFDPFLNNYQKVYFSNLFIEVDIKYLENLLILFKPLKKYFKNNNINLLIHNEEEFIIYDFKTKKMNYDKKKLDDLNQNIIGLLPFSYQKNKRIGDLYYLNYEEEKCFSDKFEEFNEDFLDFENFAYFLTNQNFFKIHKNNLSFSNSINNNLSINTTLNLNVAPSDNLEFYFFNEKNSIPLITIFIITIGGSQLHYTLKSIEKLNKKFSFIVNFIYKINPTAKAYGQMPKRCKTQYFVQCDEDMVLNENFLNHIFDVIKNNSSKNNFLFISALYDRLLGVTQTSHLWGIKTYDNIILNYFNTVDQTENIGTSSVDRYWHENLLKNELNIFKNKNIEGVHAYYRESDEFFLKIAKVTNNIFHGINKEDDNLRFIRILKDFNPNLEYCAEIFLEVFQKEIDIDEIKEEIFKILDLSKTFHERFFQNYFLKIEDINEMKLNFGQNTNKMSHFDKINFIGFLGFIYGYYGLYNYDFSLYPDKELNLIKEKIGLNKNLLIISSQIPNFGGAGTNALTLKNYLRSHFIKTYLLIVDEDKMYSLENDFAWYSPEIIICSVDYFKTLNPEKIKKIFNLSEINLIMNRNPQSKCISQFNFKKMFPDIKILSFVGGGVRIYQDKILQPFYSHYQKLLSLQKENKRIQKVMKITQPSLIKSCLNSDLIITNSLELENILKIVFPKKILGTYYSSFINKNTCEILFNYQDFKMTNWKERYYDILFICSNFKREVKNVNLFVKLSEKLQDKKILIIGKNVPFLGNHIESIDFTDNLKPYFLNSKLVINTSFYDSSPSVIMEGLYYGCNILINKNVGNFELYHSNSLIENFDDEEEWINKINKLTKYKLRGLNDNKNLIKLNLLGLVEKIVENME